MVAQGNEGLGINLVWGARDIAKIIGRSEQATFGMLENGELPAKKVNGKWVTERSKLIAFFMEGLS